MEIFAPEPVVNWISGAETTFLYSCDRPETGWPLLPLSMKKMRIRP